MEWLRGKKTYIMGGIGLIGAAAGWFYGDLSSTEAMGAAWTAITAMFLRDGITTEVAKTAPENRNFNKGDG